MKYNLVGINGNAYNVMGYVSHAMEESGFTKEEVKEYTRDATSGDYSHLLCVSSNMIDKCNERCGDTDDDEEEY